jgi:hypothetical protein
VQVFQSTTPRVSGLLSTSAGPTDLWRDCRSVFVLVTWKYFKNKQKWINLYNMFATYMTIELFSAQYCALKALPLQVDPFPEEIECTKERRRQCEYLILDFYLVLWSFLFFNLLLSG